MTTVEFSSEMTVKLIRSMASDDNVVQAAQVSVKGQNKPDTDMPRLINYLAEFRHGSPFEHSVFTYFVEAPLFVFREFQRHRIASYNEMSGRYTKLIPKFYMVDNQRPMVNSGSSARPEFEEGTDRQRAIQRRGDIEVAQHAWDVYEERIDAGIANELARTVLPLSIYSQMYVTINARSLMNFLSLRVDSLDSQYRSRPQLEIQRVAEQLEVDFKKLMPFTHAAFINNGRVAP